MIRAFVRNKPFASRALRSLVALASAVVVVAACSNDREDPNGPAPNYDLTLSAPANVTIPVDSTRAIAALTTTEGDSVQYAPTRFSVEVSDTAVVAVEDAFTDPSALLATGLAAGTATITIEYPNENGGGTLTATTTVTVAP